MFAKHQSELLRTFRSLVGQHATGQKLRERAEKILGKDELRGVYVTSGRVKLYLGYPLPESRQEMMELLQTNNGEQFVPRMVAHYEKLAEFIPTLDEIFKSGKRKRG